MDLEEYLKWRGISNEKFGKRVGVTGKTIALLFGKKLGVSIRTALRIQDETDGLVTIEDLIDEKEWKIKTRINPLADVIPLKRIPKPKNWPKDRLPSFFEQMLQNKGLK